MVIRCTQKVLKVAGVRPQSLPAADPDPDDFYVNMFWAQRKKCLVAMHAETLLSVTVLDVRVAQFRHLPALLAVEFERLLSDMVLPTDLILVSPDAQLATTASRSLLGHLNEIEAMASHHLQDQPLAECDIRGLNIEMQQMPHLGKGKMGTPRSRAMARWERQVMSG